MPANGIVSKAIERKAEVIQRISSGERLTAIARDLGYASHSGIAEALKNDPDYAEAVKHSAWAKLERREEELELAVLQPDITRADRLMAQARWWAERVNRDQFAPKPDVAIQINNIGGLENALTGDAASLLDKLRTVSITPVSTAQSTDLPFIPSDKPVSD